MPRFGGELEDDAASDAAERAVLRRGRQQLPVATTNRLSAVHSAMKPSGVEHDRLVRAGLLRVDLGEDVLQVVERLDARVDGFVRDLPRRRGHDRDAAGVELARIDAHVVDDDDHARLRARERVDAELADAARDDQADVDVVALVAAHGLLDRARISRRVSGIFSASA